MTSVDVVVVGGGIAGVSAAAALSETHRVALVEAEQALAHHTTGRSAALFLENIGGDLIRGMTISSRPYFEHPPEGLVDAPLLESRPLLCFGAEDEMSEVRSLAVEGASLVPSVQLLDKAETLARCSILIESRVAAAVYEPDSMGIDVMAVHQSFVRAMRRNGGVVQRGSADDGTAAGRP
ncbi:MAG: FAD-dependent oxidoreductase, partial [Acidimicrobiales bacterium]